VRRSAWIRLSALLVLWALTLWALALFLVFGFAALFHSPPTRAVVLVSSVCANSIALVFGSVATARRLRAEPEVPAPPTSVCVGLTLAVLQVLAASPALLAFPLDVLVGLPSPWLSVTPALLVEGVSAWNLAGSISGSATARVLAAIGFGAVFTAELILYTS